MNILAIETSHLVGSVALARDGQIVAEESFQEGMVHGRELVPRLKDLVEHAGWSPSTLDLIAVSIGPGSYTGLRVGVMTAKTLAYATQTDVVAVPSLDVLARNAPPEAETVCPVVDAKRKQLYNCLYDGSRERQGEFAVAYPEELAEDLPDGTLLLGDALEYYREVFSRPGLTVADEALWQPRAAIVAELGYRLYQGGQRDSAMALAPLYLRRPEAEDRWREKQVQEGR